MLWRLEANNGERTNGKLALYFCMNALFLCECIQRKFSHLTNILGLPKGGVVSIPPHVLAKVEKDEGLASLIRESKVAYAKALRASWDSWSWKKGSNKTT
jgi:hypothetical protein